MCPDFDPQMKVFTDCSVKKCYFGPNLSQKNGFSCHLGQKIEKMGTLCCQNMFHNNGNRKRNEKKVEMKN